MPGYGDRCYNGAGSACSGKAQPGTVALSSGVRAVYPGIGTLGIYNCRPSSGGGGSLSLHGEGRAWDAACNASTAPGLAVGNRLAATLITHHRELGIQRIIWNHRQTDVPNGMGNWRAYHGQSPHTDHLHIEQCWAAATDRKLTQEYVEGVLREGEEDMAQVPQAEWDQMKKDIATIKTAIIEKDDAKVQAATGRKTGGVMTGVYTANEKLDKLVTPESP